MSINTISLELKFGAIHWVW